MLKIASRTRSLVGRVASPLGASSFLPRADPAPTRMRFEVRAALRTATVWRVALVDPHIVCVDCGGRCHLLTSWPSDDPPIPGDVVAYRCEDCNDRWDVVVADPEEE